MLDVIVFMGGGGGGRGVLFPNDDWFYPGLSDLPYIFALADVTLLYEYPE